MNLIILQCNDGIELYPVKDTVFAEIEDECNNIKEEKVSELSGYTAIIAHLEREGASSVPGVTALVAREYDTLAISVILNDIDKVIVIPNK